jgi:hypothetical protein
MILARFLLYQLNSLLILYFSRISATPVWSEENQNTNITFKVSRLSMTPDLGYGRIEFTSSSSDRQLF